MSTSNMHGFNTSLQNVDEKYIWINDMIKARQQLILLYMKLLTLPVDQDQNKKSEYQCYPSYEDITMFCDKLIDYVSKGHFDLYPKIISLMENATGRSLSIAQKVLPKIEGTTEYLMRFNDKYSEDLNEKKLESLHKDLEQVGKCIEQRFKNEDRLIIGLRLVHSIVSMGN